MLQYYISIFKCDKYYTTFLNNEDGYKETLTNLKEHLFHDHEIKLNSVQKMEYVNKEEMQVYLFIRKQYLKLKEDAAICNHYFAICYTGICNLSLGEYLKRKHEDKLTEEQKNENRIHGLGITLRERIIGIVRNATFVQTPSSQLHTLEIGQSIERVYISKYILNN